jgi:hypothetical protein
MKVESTLPHRDNAGFLQKPQKSLLVSRPPTEGFVWMNPERAPDIRFARAQLEQPIAITQSHRGNQKTTYACLAARFERAQTIVLLQELEMTVRVDWPGRHA